jgi:hypothetical protein
MRRGALALAFGLPVAAGCAGLIGADFDAHPLAGVAEAGTLVDAPVEGAAVGCVHAEVPPNKAQGQGLGGTQDFWFAIYTVDYGDGDGVADAATYGSIGYDLDRVCTALGDPPVCVQAKHAPKDGVGGRDNAAGELFFEIKSTFQIIADPIGSKKDTAAIQTGAYTILFHVSGYNGQPDDDQVRFEWYLPAPYGSDSDASTKAPPSWTGSDRWPIRTQDSLPDGGIGPLVADDNAYVAGNVIVASLPRGTRITGGSIDFDLSGVFVTATLAPTAQGTAMTDGTLAGTWGQAQVLGGIGRLFESVGKCTDFPLYQNLKSIVCSALDVSASGVPLPTQACDALSIGVAFTAKPVLAPTSTVNVPLPTTPCPPATDPLNDVCLKDSGAAGGG